MQKIEERYFPTKSQRALVGTDDFACFIERRFYAMSWARNPWYERTQRVNTLWDVYKPWLLDGENFEKAVRFPTLRDIGRAISDEILKAPPQATLEPVQGEKPHRAQALQFKTEEIKGRPDEKDVQADCIEDMIFYGEGYRKVDHYDISRFNPKTKKTESLFNDVGTERLDPRKVYLDDQGRNLWNPKRRDIKRDAIIKYVMPRTTFIDFMQEVPGAQNLDALSPVEQPLTGDMSTPTPEESNSQVVTADGNINAYLYYNQEEQMYGLVAQNVTVLEPRTIPNDHHRIPIVNYKFERRRDDVFEGISLAELMAPYIYLQDTIVNLEIMGTKLDLMPATMIDSDLGYNRKRHKLHPRAVWEMSVPAGKKLSDGVVPFNRARRDSVGFQNLNSMIESNMTVTSGVDRTALFNQPQELATQTKLKNQTMQKRVNTIIYKNELNAEAQLTELMVSDIKQYLTEKVEMLKAGKPVKRNRKVKVKGFKVVQNGEGDATFEPAQGAENFFDLTLEAVDVDVNVRVKDMRTKLAMQEAKASKMLQFAPIVTNLVSAVGQFQPELLKKIDYSGIIEQIAEGLDMDLARTINDDAMTDFNQIGREHMAMMIGTDVPVPPAESFEQSLAHKKQHEQLRWVFKDSRKTEQETVIWKGMGKSSKLMWTKHYMATLDNIRSKILVEDNAAPPPAGPEAAAQGVGSPPRVSQPSASSEGVDNAGGPA